LLDAYFGRDGREEADEMLERHSGDPDKPRILGAFNEKTADWLSFFMFTYFTDRDGKYQLASLAESAFDPLSRTCRFMLTEEAHHMFVGETGIARVVRRACELMREHGLDDPTDVRRHGGIDLPTIQRYINFHYSVSADLFGAERSTNAASYYTSGLKGRYQETRIDDDHRLEGAVYTVPTFEDGKRGTADVNALTALNERLRDDYRADCARGLERWNKIIAGHGIDFRLALPDAAFRRAIGTFAGARFSPEGAPLSEDEWRAGVGAWLPGDDDRAYLATLMHPVTEPGTMAQWISPPARGIDGKPLDFEYVRLA
jgi:benzoyl-CoA 2,3-dioxygenase component B